MSWIPRSRAEYGFALHPTRRIGFYTRFAVDREIKYIGSCDNAETCFSSRMLRYQAIMGAGTNKRIVALLSVALANGSSVSILAWKPNDEFRVHDLPVDLVKGLENPLIGLARPEWNIQSKPAALVAEIAGEL